MNEFIRTIRKLIVYNYRIIFLSRFISIFVDDKNDDINDT